ncbi:Hypothetical predicted protein [Pelobates cultripes]|uniref:Uncharacterized protein n=1 Tax=Pelobates cultripes TaxID=61616 RepID=A0AAD1W3W1_PELCU|nr:Hypothetical predicted protein [Pelobates cultripes]
MAPFHHKGIRYLTYLDYKTLLTTHVINNQSLGLEGSLYIPLPKNHVLEKRRPTSGLPTTYS